LVEPEATVVGPVRVTVGGVPLLWHEVHVEPLFPENPEMPLLDALAGIDEWMTANITRMIETHEMRDRTTGFLSERLGIDDAVASWVVFKGEKRFLFCTGASFHRRRSRTQPGGRKMQVVQVLKPIGPETRGGAQRTTASVQEVAGAYIVAQSYRDEINICKVRAKMDIDKFSEVQ
jgi:hypothetical protein